MQPEKEILSKIDDLNQRSKLAELGETEEA